jgi:hypothetical protein
METLTPTGNSFNLLNFEKIGSCMNGFSKIK